MKIIFGLSNNYIFISPPNCCELFLSTPPLPSHTPLALPRNQYNKLKKTNR